MEDLVANLGMHMLTRARRSGEGGYLLVQAGLLPSAAGGKRLPPAVLPICIGLMLLAPMFPNSMLVVAATVLLLIGSALLWRPGESPVLLFVFGFQWLQISTGIFYASWLGLNVNEFSHTHGDMQTAATLSLIGLLLLSCCIRLGAGAARPKDSEITGLSARRHPTKDWFALYVAAFLIAILLQMTALVIPSLSQPLLAMANLKWAFFVMLTYSAFSAGGARAYWLMAFAIELSLALGSYFFDFKTAFVFTIFGLVAAQVRFSARVYIIMAVLVALLLTMGVVWTEIKPQYRKFVSGGQSAQVVTVGLGERVGKLSELVTSIDGAAFSDGVDSLIERLAYIDFFAAVINHVPSVVPYQGGAIWWDAVVRPFTPRILFPEKSAIDDSAETNKYTGLNVAGADKGVSIGIGYMAETYIDFGALGMMPVLAAFGYFLGRVYRYFMTSACSRGLLGMGLASAIINVAGKFETSISKTLGGVIVMLLVSQLLIRIVVPKCAPWVVEREGKQSGGTGSARGFPETASIGAGVIPGASRKQTLAQDPRLSQR
jgi:hypothetical protein